MILFSSDLVVLVALSLTVVEFILALYVLLLNIWHSANRHVSGLLALLAANTAGIALLAGAGGATQAYWAMAILAVTTPAVQPVTAIVALILVKPDWLRGRGVYLRWLLYALALLPAAITALDIAAGTGLWFVGQHPQDYVGGFVVLGEYTQGSIRQFISFLYFAVISLAAMLPLAYVALLDRRAGRNARQLAGLLLAALVIAAMLEAFLSELLGPTVAALTVTTSFVVVFGYASFRQMISERRIQRGRLQVRLTLLIMAVSLPLFLVVAVSATSSFLSVLARNADERLGATNRAVVANSSVWLDLNVQTLQQIAALPDIVSMDPERQKPVLELVVESYPHLSLASTIDVDGVNIARSDDLPAANYRQAFWHLGARNGLPVTFDVVLDPARQRPEMVLAVPIRRELGTIVGVVMFASRLDTIAQEVQASKVGERGYAYIVDGLNQVVAHPDPVYAAELRDLDYYAPVYALRGGERGLIEFVDEAGVEWRAYVEEMENGWGVIVQQPLEDLRAPVRRSQFATWSLVGIGIVVLLVLVALTTRQALEPVGALTQTAIAIADGDLDREAPAESEDEIGLLAHAFNSMTRQLRNLIGSLEQQVAERTSELARRSDYLEATADVASAASSILDRDQLVQQVVELVRSRFGLYYVGLFLVDAAEEWVILKAGTGTAGRAMVERGHRIRVGEGMIGWSVAHRASRVAEVAEQDAVRLATPELPETRSEAALPLRSRGRVLGALTVQHIEPGAFDENTMAVLQTMADQVAVALDNALLFAASQDALEAARRAYGDISRRSWSELLGSRKEWGYRYARYQVTRTSSAKDGVRPELEEAARTGQPVVRARAGDASRAETGHQTGNGDHLPSLALPLKVRGDIVGVIGFRKDVGAGEWSGEEQQLLEAFAGQLEVALESARLYQDTQRRAARERAIRHVTDRMRRSVEIETILKSTIVELARAMGAPRAYVRLGTEDQLRARGEWTGQAGGQDGEAAGAGKARQG